MRRFTDAMGRPWDVVLGRESWGTLLALFVPVGVGRTEPVVQAPLRSAGYDEAHLELDDLDDTGLRELFRSAVPKPT